MTDRFLSPLVDGFNDILSVWKTIAAALGEELDGFSIDQADVKRARLRRCGDALD